MLFRHHTDTTITPDTLFEAKGPFEDSRIFKILGFFSIFYRILTTVQYHTVTVGASSPPVGSAATK